jgi:hypothetical protein
VFVLRTKSPLTMVCGSISTTCGLSPHVARLAAHSSPMYPPPMTTAFLALPMA